MAARGTGTRIVAGLGLMVATAGCVRATLPGHAEGSPHPAISPAPPPPPSLIITSVPEELEAAPPMRAVTLTAVNVDVRALLPALAEAAELSLVMGPQVEGRVTVNFVDVPADEAIRLVLAEAGLMIEQPAFRSPWAPVVFYALPVNIDTAEPELLRARYHISAEMAQWLVDTRIR